jgi:sulfatase maturation enzyme AslB (radical SAM superfamily)
MCSADVSSAFAAEYKALNWGAKSKIKDADYSDILLTIPKSTKSIGYVNGEFFLDKTGDDVLSIVADRNIELTITTNSSYITDKHIDKLKNINKNISVSLDGVDSLYPIMRYPSDWQTFNSVFEKIMLMPNIQFIKLNMVIQNLNVFDMINVMKFGYEHKITTWVSLVKSNPWLLFDALDDVDRNSAIAMLTSQLSIERTNMSNEHVRNVEEYIQLLKNTVHNPILNNQLVRKLAKIWKHRNLDYSYYENIYPTLYRKVVDHNEQSK